MRPITFARICFIVETRKGQLMENKEKRLAKIDIPSYSLNQERFNSVSHFFGLPIGVFVIVSAIVLFSVKQLSLSFFFGLLIFGVSIISLYLISGLYHFESPTNEKAKKIKRVLDHCTIYLLIAGTYTPICLYIGTINQIGYIVLILEWIMAAVGILLNAIDFSNKIVQGVSMALYLGLGWLILFTGSFTYLPDLSFTYILIGGISYTVGSILYGVGHSKIWFHSVFHVFVLIGTILQTVGVILLFK